MAMPAALGAGLLFNRLQEFGEVYGVDSDASLLTEREQVDQQIH